MFSHWNSLIPVAHAEDVHVAQLCHRKGAHAPTGQEPCHGTLHRRRLGSTLSCTLNHMAQIL